jgi:hypothetical protein
LFVERVVAIYGIGVYEPPEFAIVCGIIKRLPIADILLRRHLDQFIPNGLNGKRGTYLRAIPAIYAWRLDTGWVSIHIDAFDWTVILTLMTVVGALFHINVKPRHHLIHEFESKHLRVYHPVFRHWFGRGY